MLVQMTTGLSGPAITLNPGDEHDFPQDEAVRLIAAGYAIPVSEAKVEHAVPSLLIERRDDDVRVQPRHKQKKRR